MANKTVFSTDEVAHIWAQQSQPHGKNPNGSLFFRDSMIFSYGEHFPVARFLPDGSVAITTQKRSVTTTRHTWLVRRAVSDKVQIEVFNVLAEPRQAKINAERDIAIFLQWAATARGEAKGIQHRAEAIYAAEQFNLYSKAHRSRLRINATKIAGQDLSQIKAHFLAQEKARVAAEKARVESRKVGIAEGRKRWRDHMIAGGMYDGSVMLRLNVNGLEIDTSHGAHIPIEDAKRLWPIILRVRNGDRDYEVGMELGRYRLTKIKQDGSIVVGCHDIGFDEIEAMAVQLGLTELAVA